MSKLGPDPTEARRVLQWYEEHKTVRDLPWRRPDCNPDLRAMAEGLCYRTRPEAVAQRWDDIAGDLEGAYTWLALPTDERLRRAGLLGRGKRKREIVDWIARTMIDARALKTLPGKLEGGERGYVRNVVRMLFGMPGAAFDRNLERVAGRYGCPPGALPHAVTSGAMNPDEAGVEPGAEPSAVYRAFCGLLDVAELLCWARGGYWVNCKSCPLKAGCDRATARRKNALIKRGKRRGRRSRS